MLILFYCLLSVVALQFIFYYFIFTETAFSKEKGLSNEHFEDFPISVLLYTKNSSHILEENIIPYLSQDYASFEIVLINDCSSDDTLLKMRVIEEKHPLIKVVNVESNDHFWKNKKYALTLAIKAAKYENLIFADIHCIPISKNWLKSFGQKLKLGVSPPFVVGHTYVKGRNSLLNQYFRYESFFSSLLGLSFIKSGMPFRGNPSNMSYQKKTFFEMGGFMKYMNILESENLLFVDHISKNHKVSTLISKDAMVMNKSKGSLSAVFYNLCHFFHNSRRFRFKHRLVLSLFGFSQLSFWVLATILLYYKYDYLLTLWVIAARFVFVYLILFISSIKLKATSTIIFLPIFEVFSQLMKIFAYLKALSKKTLAP